ncbi:hypothetical protein HERIO_2783 [Hepatospora eriocheir]|uniref:Uncharacterized protein n=1 Tax=Hepatospora eriocheir TaxID=1081669 RepID=A0A1X0Q752_9MICR|nr:hypothetical protein HERIO_2783 [Hepatospora eriocheir]
MINSDSLLFSLLIAITASLIIKSRKENAFSVSTVDSLLLLDSSS